MQQTNNILIKVASYIEATQPRIDEDNKRRIAFTKRATQAAGILAHRGIIAGHAVDGFVDTVSQDPSAVWDVVEKLAAHVAPDNLGTPTRHKAAASKVDPWERVFFGVDAVTPGMID